MSKSQNIAPVQPAQVEPAPQPPTGYGSIADLNDACADIVQKASAYLSKSKQIGGSYDDSLILSQAIYQCLNIQDAIERYLRKSRPGGGE